MNTIDEEDEEEDIGRGKNEGNEEDSEEDSEKEKDLKVDDLVLIPKVLNKQLTKDVDDILKDDDSVVDEDEAVLKVLGDTFVNPNEHLIGKVIGKDSGKVVVKEFDGEKVGGHQRKYDKQFLRLAARGEDDIAEYYNKHGGKGEFNFFFGVLFWCVGVLFMLFIFILYLINIPNFIFLS